MLQVEKLSTNMITNEILKSWSITDYHTNSIEEILQWINNRNNNIHVSIKKVGLSKCVDWFYNASNGQIMNKKNSYFSVTGYRVKSDQHIISEQPMIIQNEIGYLGIICSIVDGVLQFLMQAKTEPGNINTIQISPTIQATKSNFMQVHGGKKPPYLDYFLNSKKYDIIIDQIQSEQSSRFIKKRNRNIIIFCNETIEILPSHKWMTLGQLKQLMKIDNLVNMDTRTVISCLPFSLFQNDVKKEKNLFKDPYLFNSLCNEDSNAEFQKLFNEINDMKMFNTDETSLIPLFELNNWNVVNNEFVSSTFSSFKLIFCNVEIDGREITKWSQPLFASNGPALFGLLMCNHNMKKEFLVRVKKEIGCFDCCEIGPSVQIETYKIIDKKSNFENFFLSLMERKKGIIYDVMMSEEGGRFYHEENRNVIIETDFKDLEQFLDEYILVDYKTLNLLIQSNNVVNIQLRNLLSLLEI